jgi:hypothetical protein
MSQQKNGANYDSEKSSVSLRSYLENSIAELAKRTDAQFAAMDKAIAAALASAEKAVAAALVAQDKLTSAAFAAAKEALMEAQTQLVAYKASSNEWRGTLTDLISKVMTRQEIEALLLNINGSLTEAKDRISVLEGQGQRASGQAEAQDAGHAQNKWTFQQVLAIFAVLAGWGITIILYLLKKP